MPKLSLRWFILFTGIFLLAVGTISARQQGGVRVVVVNEFANIRIAPALGADVVDTVSAGFEFTIVNGRSADNEWIRVDYLGTEGWVNLVPLHVLQGDVFSLPVADPRTIPYGGFEAPRAGPTNAFGTVFAVATDGLRLRAGPSRAYPTLANIPINTYLTVTGRTGSGLWYQVIFDQTLGWVAGNFLQFQGLFAGLPLDGIIADSPPVSQPTANDYVSQLLFMRDRLDLAQPSLDQIRGSWTDSALSGRAQCSSYPARPSDIHIAVPLLAAFYPTLDPLQTQFNDAMFNLRLAIDLFIEVCNQPGTGNPVGSATVQGALDAVNLADSQFASIRARLNELIPSEQGIGANQCLLSYANQTELLPLISPATIYIDTFDARNTINGYCIDLLPGQVMLFDSLQLPNSNITLFFSMSRLDNPTNFIAIGTAVGTELTVSPIRIAEAGRYLVILHDIGVRTERPEPTQGDFAFILLDITNLINNPELVYDPLTGVISVTAPQVAAPVQDTTTGGETTSCPSLGFTCNQLFSCAEAQACLGAGNFSLDPDADGVPCEENLCSAP